MKKLRWLLALAAVAAMAFGCEEEKKTTTTTTDTTSGDTAVGDAAGTDAVAGDSAGTDATAGDTTAGDTAATDVAADVSAAAATGCTGATDKTFREGLAKDQAKYGAFAGKLSDCTLKKSCLAKTGDSVQIACIGTCITEVYAAEGLTTPCGNCFGMTGWCAAKKCLASCAADATSQACADCRKTNCDPAAAACYEGTCDPLADKHCAP